MDQLEMLREQVPIFTLVMIRTGALVFSAPIFGSPNIPMQLKAGSTFLISLLLFPLIPLPELGSIDLSPINYGLYVIKESMIGMIISFIVLMLMNSFFIAGQVIDTQMGIGVTNVIDPLSKTHIPIAGQIEFLFAIMIFLSINGPAYLIKSLLWSYKTLPIATLELPNAGKGILQTSAEMWLIAFRIGAPAIAILLLTMVAIGIVAKTVPNMNIFIVGFPITVGVGLMSLYVSMLWFRPLVEELLNMFFRKVGLFVGAI